MKPLDDRLSGLSPEQRALLERRLRARGRSGSAPSGTARDPAGGATVSEPADAWRGRTPLRPVELSIYLFSDDGSDEGSDKYRLALSSARFADAHRFRAVWTPERHFQGFGGLYPNPSVLGAALAAITSRIEIRAGSVASPLHHPVRVAEEWAVVDNLSNGRVGISFASGWHPDDFILFPSPYEERKETMFRGIETIRRLWAGEAVSFTAHDERTVAVRTYPRPVRAELPIWVTSAGNPETWARAGAIGANVLAALVGYAPEDLTAQVAAYRAARAAAGHDPATGIVSLVAHTFVGEDDRAVRDLVRAPMTRYLQTYLQQFAKLGLERTDNPDRDARDVAALAFEHYFDQATLLGTQNKCARVLDALGACGADEVACLIDFGLETDTVLDALPRLAELQQHYRHAAPAAGETHETAPGADGGPHART
ncbi:MAG: LLM class flavin-dependent oxidoreductase [Candidatus Eisenbacteria bacterium]|nr:LLM class flavin-dependent oxidoreductase [Candidatus Eisenbacteria bacterium]